MEQLGCRWEDEAEAALERAGFSVVDRAGEVDYHGWGVLLGSNGGEFAVISWSYGSCSGCDQYEEMPADTLAAEFDGMITKGLTEEEARLKFSSSTGW